MGGEISGGACGADRPVRSAELGARGCRKGARHILAGRVPDTFWPEEGEEVPDTFSAGRCQTHFRVAEEVRGGAGRGADTFGGLSFESKECRTHFMALVLSQLWGGTRSDPGVPQGRRGRPDTNPPKS